MKLFKKGLIALLALAFSVALAMFAAACNKDNGQGGNPPTPAVVSYKTEVYLQGENGYAVSDEHSSSGSGNVGDVVTATPVEIENYVFKQDYDGNVTQITLDADESKNVLKLYYDQSSVPGETSVHRDRFGGADLIITTSDGDKVYLRRGGHDFEGEYSDGAFTFTMPNGEKLEGKVYDDGSFSYKKEEFAGTYTYYNSYYDPTDPEGNNALVSTDVLTLDEYGNGTHSYKDAITGASVSDPGFLSFVGGQDETAEYMFLITGGPNADNGFTMRFSEVNKNGTDIRVFSSSYGEANIYYEADTPDGNVFYMNSQGGTIILDGYGKATLQEYYYTGEFSGIYYSEGIYGNNNNLFIYKIHLIFNDQNNVAQRLGYAVKDGKFEIQCYTMPLSEDEYVYVTPRVEAGEYTGANGATLKLDGYRNFADSATYTVGGRTYTGMYTATMTQTKGVEIDFNSTDESGIPTGVSFKFAIPLDDTNSFSVVASGTGRDYVLLGGDFSYDSELLVIYDEVYDGVDNAVKAELWTQGAVAGSYAKAASGYVTQETLKGNMVTLSTFTRTEVEAGADGKSLPKSFKFQLSSYFNQNYLLQDLYFVFEYTYEGDAGDRVVKNYIDVQSAAGDGAHMWYMDVGVNTLGCIFYEANGTASYGGFTVSANYGDIFGDVGAFIWFDEQGYSQTTYFAVEYDENGDPGTIEEVAELEYPIYIYNSDGSLNETVQFMVRGMDGVWSATGNFDTDRVEGTLQYLGDVGDYASYAFVTSEGATLFKYIADLIMYQEEGGFMPVEIWVMYIYNADYDKTYTASDGSTLKLDGYNSAVYTSQSGVVSGTYSLDNSGKTVYLRSRGSTMMFDISGQTLTIMDGMFGTYAIELYSGEWYDITFDGHGNLTAETFGQGRYVVEDGQCTIFLYIDGKNVSYDIRLNNNNEAIILNEKTQGTFVGEDWSILVLSGYGDGTYYAADGSSGVRLNYFVIDGDLNYISTVDYNFNYDRFVLDDKTHTMVRPEFFGSELVYFDSEFIPLIFTPEGDVNAHDNSGDYMIIDGVLKIYLMGEKTIETNVLPDTSADTYVFENKTYYRWRGTKSVTFTGKINIDYSELGLKEEWDATLTFNVLGEPDFETAATFIANGKTYSVTVKSRYTDYNTGTRKGLCFMDTTDYTYSPLTVVHYDPVNGSTFRIDIVAQSETRYVDRFEQEDGIDSTISEYYVGFGPIRLTETKVMGDIYIGPDGNGGEKRLKFTDASVETIAVDSDYGYIYQTLFEDEGTLYAMQYAKFDFDYAMYVFGTYEYVETDGYTVGVLKYVYSNDSYEFYEDPVVGRIHNFVLYKGTGASRVPVLAFNRMLNRDGLSGWVIDNTTTSLTGAAKIYTVNFASEELKEVTVKQYTLKQAIQDENQIQTWFVNFLMENGEIAGVAGFGLDGVIMSLDGVEVLEEGVSWFLRCADAQDSSGTVYDGYKITLQKNEAGEYVSDETGEFWYVSFELYNEQ